MSMGMAIPMLVNSLTSLNKVFGITNALQNAGIVLGNAKLTSLASEIIANKALNDEQKANLLTKTLGISTD
jgi:hypothetical protein